MQGAGPGSGLNLIVKNSTPPAPPAHPAGCYIEYNIGARGPPLLHTSTHVHRTVVVVWSTTNVGKSTKPFNMTVGRPAERAQSGAPCTSTQPSPLPRHHHFIPARFEQPVVSHPPLTCTNLPDSSPRVKTRLQPPNTGAGTRCREATTRQQKVRPPNYQRWYLQARALLY